MYILDMYIYSPERILGKTQIILRIQINVETFLDSKSEPHLDYIHGKKPE